MRERSRPSCFSAYVIGISNADILTALLDDAEL